MNGTSSSSASSRSSSSAKSTPRRSLGGAAAGSASSVSSSVDQRSALDHRVQLGRLIRLGLEAVFLARRRPRAFPPRPLVRKGAGAHPPVAQGLLGVELGAALGTGRRAAAQIVEFARTGWANLFGAQFGIGQCGDLYSRLAGSGGSLAMAGGHCQKQSPSHKPAPDRMTPRRPPGRRRTYRPPGRRPCGPRHARRATSRSPTAP